MRVVIVDEEARALAELRAASPRLADDGVTRIAPFPGTVLRQTGDTYGLLPYTQSTAPDGALCARWDGRLTRRARPRERPERGCFAGTGCADGRDRPAGDEINIRQPREMLMIAPENDVLGRQDRCDNVADHSVQLSESRADLENAHPMNA